MSSFGPPPGVNPAMPTHSSAPPVSSQAKADDPTRVVVGPLVISYPNLFIPRRKDSKDPSSPLVYSAELICFAENPAYQTIYQKLMTAANIVCQDKFKRSIDTLEKQPLRPIKIRPGMEARNGFFFGANSNAQYGKPNVYVGNPAVPVTDPDVIYPGAIVYVTVKAGAYDSNGNKGIKFYLNGVLKAADGTPLVTPRDGARDFDGVMAEMPATPPQQSFQAPPMSGYDPAQQYQAPPTHSYPPQGAPMVANVPQMPGYPPQVYAQPQVMPPMPGYAMPAGYPQH